MFGSCSFTASAELDSAPSFMARVISLPHPCGRRSEGLHRIVEEARDLTSGRRFRLADVGLVIGGGGRDGRRFRGDRLPFRQRRRRRER